MRFVANVEVNHRIAAAHSLLNSPQKSFLTFGRKYENPNILILVHQSCHGKVESVYRVDCNIDKIYDRYVSEGKMTIHFKEPSHDLIINGEVTVLKKFNLLLKIFLQGDFPFVICKLPCVRSDRMKKIPSKLQQYLSNPSKSEYPVLDGIPRSSVRIRIGGFQKPFDMSLLGFPQLKVLDLSDNQITEIPAEIDLLQSLKELSLANNHLGAGNKTAWAWLHGERISRQLQELDLSDNELTFLHPSVCHLRALRCLSINNNGLTLLPDAIGLLNHLKALDISDNLLRFMPGCIFLQKLCSLDVSDNLFVEMSRRKYLVSDFIFPSLKELAARCVANNRPA